MVQEITIDSSGATGSKPSSKIIFIIIGVILIVAVAGGVAWVVWQQNQNKGGPPTVSPGRSKGSNWICAKGSMGDLVPHSSSDGDYCKLSYAQEGDYCQLTDGVGSCTLTPAPAAADPTKLVCIERKTPDAETCSDYCYNNTDAVYALWNSTDTTCACRPTRADTYWDRCIYDKDDKYSTCAASENAPNCVTVPVISPVPNFVAGTISPIASIYTPTAEKCALEVGTRNLESTDSGVMGVFEAGVTNNKNCFIKSTDLNVDPLADCITPTDPGKYWLILPTSDSKISDKINCIPTRPVTINGNIDTNPTLRPTPGQGATSQNTCSKICGDGNMGDPTAVHKYAQAASLWDGTTSTCKCYDWPAKIDNICGDPVSSKTLWPTVQVRSDKDDPLNPYWHDMTNPLASQGTITNECKPPFLSGDCTCGDDGNPIQGNNHCATDRTPVCTHLYKDTGGYNCTCVGGLNASFATWTAATYSNRSNLKDSDCVGGQVIGSSINPNDANFCGLRNTQAVNYISAGSAAKHAIPDVYCVAGTHYVDSPDPSLTGAGSGFCQFDGW